MGKKTPAATPEPVKVSPSRYKDVGAKPKGLIKVIKWRRLVRGERKKLRADLKSYGITDRKAFEDTAYELGLVYNKTRYAGLLGWLFWLWDKLLTTALVKILLAGGALVLGGMFMYSYVTEQAGSFTINLTPNTMQKNFELSETADFSKATSRLSSDVLDSVSNITLSDIAEDVDMIDGPHNGPNYIAFTFYIRNGGNETASYQYEINVTSASLGVDKVTWVMVFEDGKQSIYAAPPLSDSGTGDETAPDTEAETGATLEPGEQQCQALFGYKDEPPFYNCAYNPDMYYTETQNGRTLWGVKANPFVGYNNTTVVQGVTYDVQPGEIHKYTIVIWVEGNDPDCNNDIFGGHAKLAMNFNAVNREDKDLFSGLYRIPYDDYISTKGDEEVTTAVETKEQEIDDVGGITPAVK